MFRLTLLRFRDKVEEMEEYLPPAPVAPTKTDKEEDNTSIKSDPDDDLDEPIATWTYCLNCKKVVTPLVFISDNTWKFSFGKFLEVFFLYFYYECNYHTSIILCSRRCQFLCCLDNKITKR